MNFNENSINGTFSEVNTSLDDSFTKSIANLRLLDSSQGKKTPQKRGGTSVLSNKDLNASNFGAVENISSKLEQMETRSRKKLRKCENCEKILSECACLDEIHNLATLARIKHTKSSKKTQQSKILNRNYLVIPFFVLIMYLCWLSNEKWCFYKTKNSLNVKELGKELRTSVLHQENAVETLLNVLENLEGQRKVMIFVGPTGVGKTFISNAVKKNMDAQLVHSLNKDNLKNLESLEPFLDQLSKCCLNLITIDDLRTENLPGLINFLNLVPNNLSVAFILIFNNQYMDDNFIHHVNETDVQKIENVLTENKVNFAVSLFKKFDSTDVYNWVKSICLKGGLNLNDEKLDYFMQIHDFENFGLKGIFPKLKLMYNLDFF